MLEEQHGLLTIPTLTSLTKSRLRHQALPWRSSKHRLLLRGPSCGDQHSEPTNRNSDAEHSPPWPSQLTQDPPSIEPHSPTHTRSRVLQVHSFRHLLGAARRRLSHERLVLRLGAALVHLGILHLLGQIRDQRPDKRGDTPLPFVVFHQLRGKKAQTRDLTAATASVRHSTLMSIRSSALRLALGAAFCNVGA